MRRVFDVSFAFLLLAILFPVLVAVYFSVRVFLRGPAIFKQARTGLNGKNFDLYKFRSMTNETDANGLLLPDEHRLTAFGKFLRASSLDELPGFYNVLIGDMSVIGPRPQTVALMERCTERQFRRHEVRPGITGWAQVNGRNSITWEQRFELDVWYVDNRSFWIDLQILLKTVKVTLLRDGVAAKGHATMPEFNPTQRYEPAE